MSKFLTSLQVERVPGKDRWITTAPLRYQSDTINGAIIEVPVGFETDFASVPRLPFVYLAVGGCGEEAATIHDYLYRYQAVSRSVADSIFYEALRECGISWVQARTMYLGVRAFGWAHY